MIRHAYIENGHRNWLLRNWDGNKPRLLFIGLNPSKADDKEDDATIRRLIHFSKKRGCGSFMIINLYTKIATKRKDLIAHIKEDGDLCPGEWILKCHSEPVAWRSYKKVIFMWGGTKQAKERAKYAISRFPFAYCFGHTKDGSPKHPLYLPNNTKLIRYDTP